MAVICHLGFLQLKYWVWIRFRVDIQTIYAQFRSSCCWYMVIFLFFSKMVAICYFGFVILCLDHPQRVFAGVCGCPKFGYIRCSRFENMQISILCALDLTCIFISPKFGFWEYFNSSMGCSVQPWNVPSLCGNMSHDIYIVKIQMWPGHDKWGFPVLFSAMGNPQKLLLPLGGSAPLAWHGFLGPTNSSPRNSITISSAVLSGLTTR